MKKISFIVILLFYFNTSLKSQNVTKNEFKRVSLDFDFGIALFYGDIKSKASTTFSFKANYHLTSALSLFTDLSFVNLKGAETPEMNSFNNNGFRFLAGGEVYLFNILRFNKISNFLQPFGGVGIGAFKNNFSKSIILDTKIEIPNKNWHLIYQFFGGVKLYLLKNIDINVRAKLNFSKTDFLDNYKPDVTANKYNDAFVSFSAGLTVHLGKKKKDPLIWNAAENYLFFLPRNAQFQNRSGDDDDAFSKRKPKKKTSTEAPIYKSPEEEEYQDEEENEFDCIIKF